MPYVNIIISQSEEPLCTESSVTEQGFFSVHTFMSLLFLLQVFTCGNSTHLLRRERNVVTVMPCFMSDTLSYNTRRPTRMRSVSSVSSVTTAADRCGSSGIGKIGVLILNYNF